ncbi:YeeE/YedE family protein [Hwanghaeella sp.]|uniref:YeeE/YedE family protein n=1 Tax=Hwanghaeella sp. TaxID=2605943 RepID=UPI003CCC1549
MYIDFTDWTMGLVGGLFIGSASALFLLGLGRIAGISGITGDMLMGNKSGRFMENLAFVAGLVLCPLIYAQVAEAPVIEVTDSLPYLIVGGLLVGFGTRLGNGCTSGHGVCGLSRLSIRSLIATGAFMVVAALVVALLKTRLG